MIAIHPSAGYRRAVRFLRWTPEWWMALPIGAAWLLLVAHAAGGGAAPAAVTAGHAHHAAAPAGPAFDVARAVTSLADWTVMTVAMMLPVSLPAVRHVSFNSIRRRRWRAMALFALAFLVPWIAFGAFAIAGVAVAGRWLEPGLVIAATLLAAAIYQASEPKRRAVLTCRRVVPLPADGLRADVGVIRFGLVTSWRCMRSCWALMLLMAAVGHASLVAMVGITALVLAEESVRGRRRILVPSAVVLAGLAAAALVVALV
jgi:predicted metal-binding membrane protein